LLPALPARWRRTVRACNRSTIHNIALAWVLTLPAAMILSGTLYFIFSRLF
jgi:phosphate/sulfate permease